MPALMKNAHKLSQDIHSSWMILPSMKEFVFAAANLSVCQSDLSGW